MTSPECIIEAAREESRSNGPGPSEGEAEHKYRELKSSIDSQRFVIPGEDPAELELLIESYRESFEPETALEWFLVDSLIAADWEMRRVQRIRVALLQKEMQAGASLAEAYERPAVARVDRRKAAVERSLYRALKEMQRIFKQEADAQDREKKGKKEQERALVGTLSTMAKLASFRQTGGRRKDRTGTSPESAGPKRDTYRAPSLGGLTPQQE
jgi:hypothetical protein